MPESPSKHSVATKWYTNAALYAIIFMSMFEVIFLSYMYIHCPSILLYPLAGAKVLAIK